VFSRRVGCGIPHRSKSVGFSIINASLELSEAYDQRVIDFFRQSLGQL
jgi:hypothetical protein